MLEEEEEEERERERSGEEKGVADPEKQNPSLRSRVEWSGSGETCVP